MLAAGEAPKVVAELLGHSPTITMNVYQHLMPGWRSGRESSDRLLGGECPLTFRSTLNLWS